MRIERAIKDTIVEHLSDAKKVIALYGARQTGKTTIADSVLEEIGGKQLKINADEIKYHDILSSRDFTKIKLLLEGYDLLFIDEAQRIQEIGINLKIIKDNMPNLQVFVTGSSSFELASKIKESLTGRVINIKFYPISSLELRNYYNVFELKDRLEEYMIYGMYPEILTANSIEKKELYLTELASSYLFKDTLELSSIKNSSKIKKLVQLLALQVGSEVSVQELSNALGMSKETVNTYIDLLEQAFVVFRLYSFSKNLRKEISKRCKVYFYDLGVRNSMINNFAPLNLRTDKGGMWENFLIVERMKMLEYKRLTPSTYFWRTYTGAELDYVEDKNGQLYGYEIKYKKKRKKAPATWVDNYGDNFQSINIDNFYEFIL